MNYTKQQTKKVQIYFAASAKVAEKGCGPSGTAAILQYVKPCGGVAEKLHEAPHPLLTAPQAQMTAAIEGLQALKQKGLELTLIGNSADVEGWVTGQYKYGSKTKNKKLVETLISLMKVHTVTFCRPAADEDKFLRCKHFAEQMAEEQQKKRFEMLVRDIGIGAGAYRLSSEDEEEVQHALFH